MKPVKVLMGATLTGFWIAEAVFTNVWPWPYEGWKLAGVWLMSFVGGFLIGTGLWER
jgi:hypothetical protein